MIRPFLNLYAILVISILVIGWGINRLWENIASDSEVPVEISALMSALEKSEPAQGLVDDFNSNNESLSIQIISADHFSKSSGFKNLDFNEIQVTRNESQIVWIKYSTQRKQFILISKAQSRFQENMTRGLLILFYVGLALVIFIWVWPLSRDAKRLEAQTQRISRRQLPEELHLGKSSTLYPLADAFNRMLQRLRQMMGSYADMTNAVSHELRTPLARMKFAIALLDNKKLDKNSINQIQSISKDIEEMEYLINSLLTYAGYEQQTTDLQVQSAKAVELIAKMEDRFKRSEKKLPRLYCEDLTQDAWLKAEWRLLETAVQNLLSNASRYAREKIRLTISVDDTHCWISVEDDGPGVNESIREKIFQSFVRFDQENFDKGNNEQTKGFGLGLAIVKRIMEWHQGAVEVKASAELGGAEFILRWPRGLG